MTSTGEEQNEYRLESIGTCDQAPLEIVLEPERGLQPRKMKRNPLCTQIFM